MHDCVASIKPDIIEMLEKIRDDEINERKVKRKKMIEDEERQKKENKDKKLQQQQQQQEAANKAANFTEVEAKVENDTPVNTNTERLADSIVEQVLAPAMAAAGTNNTAPAAETGGADQGSSMELEPAAATNAADSVQTDNEISEMICSETTAEQAPEPAEDRPVDMEVNGDSRESGTIRGSPSAATVPTDDGDVDYSLMPVLTREDVPPSPRADGINTVGESLGDFTREPPVLENQVGEAEPEAEGELQMIDDYHGIGQRALLSG